MQRLTSLVIPDFSQTSSFEPIKSPDIDTLRDHFVKQVHFDLPQLLAEAYYLAFQLMNEMLQASFPTRQDEVADIYFTQFRNQIRLFDDDKYKCYNKINQVRDIFQNVKNLLLKLQQTWRPRQMNTIEAAAQRQTVSLELRHDLNLLWNL